MKSNGRIIRKGGSEDIVKNDKEKVGISETSETIETKGDNNTKAGDEVRTEKQEADPKAESAINKENDIIRRKTADEATITKVENSEGGQDVGRRVEDVKNAGNNRSKITYPNDIEAKNEISPTKVKQSLVNLADLEVDDVTINRVNTYYSGLELNTNVYTTNLDFELDTEISPYINYKTVINTNYGDGVKTSYDPLIEKIIEKGMNEFKYGTLYSTKVLNTNAIKVPVFTNDIPNADLIESVGNVNVSVDMSKYISGLISIMTIVAADKRILQAKDVLDIRSYDSVVQELVEGPILEKDGVNPAVYLFTNGTALKWLSDILKKMVSDGEARYWLGRKDSEYNPNIGIKKRDNFGCNIDMYAAEIYNLNLNYLTKNGTNIEHIRRGILAHSFEGTIISFPNNYGFRPKLKIQQDDALKKTLLMLMRYPDVIGMIHYINMNYVKESGMVKLTNEKNIYYKDQQSTVAASQLTGMINQRASSATEEDVHSAYAREYTPNIYINKLVPMPTEEFRRPESIVMIFELIVFSLFFPSAFNSIIGEVQNVVLKFVGYWWPQEYMLFKTNNGFMYRYVNGVKEIAYNTEIMPSDLSITEWFPSFFDFSATWNNCPRMTKLRDMFKPKGELVDDIRAINAEFPRLNSKHYNAFTRYGSQLIDNMTIIFGNICDTLTEFTLEKAKSRGAEYDRSMQTAIGAWFEEMKRRTEDISLAHSIHAYHVNDTLGNMFFNIMLNTDGDYGTFKRVNYTITSDQKQEGSLIMDRGETSNGLSYINTSIIWTILGSTSWPVLQEKGRDQIKVPIDMRPIIPDGSISYSQSLDLYTKLSNTVLAEAIVSYIISPEIEDSDSLRWLREHLLPLRNTHYRNMVIELTKILKTNLPDYGKLDEKHLGKMTMELRLINPRIRRRNLNTTIADYDPSIDPAGFEGVATFMNEIELLRFKVGMQLALDSGLFGLNKGLILYNMSLSRYDPDFCPSVPPGFVTRTFNVNMFTADIIGPEKKVVYIHTDGTKHYDSTLLPKVFLKIEKTYEVDPFLLSFITRAVHSGNWMVLLENVYYTWSIDDYSKRDSTGHDVTDLLKTPKDGIRHVVFFDSCLTPTPSEGMLPGLGEVRSIIFPITSISRNISLRGLVSGTNYQMLPRSAYPTSYEIDTGSYSISTGELLYSNGARKLDIKSRICMTNVVSSLSSNVELPTIFEYNRMDPPSLKYS
jgi:hypothetical protein